MAAIEAMHVVADLTVLEFSDSGLTDPGCSNQHIDDPHLDDAVPYDLWAPHAACKGRTPLFFPPKAERPQARARREHKARLLCAGCPVQISCRDFARTNREYGYWAGESEEDRHLLGYTVSAPIGIRARAFDPDGARAG